MSENKQSSVFGGVFLVTLGVLFLFNNYSQVDVWTWQILTYWPVVLIILGILALFGRLVNLIVSIVFGVLLAMFVFSFFSGNWISTPKYKITTQNSQKMSTQSQSLDFNNQERVKLMLELGAVSFDLNSGTNKLVEIARQSTFAEHSLSTTVQNGIQEVSYNSVSGVNRVCIFCKPQNVVSMLINDDPMWNLDINAGASKSTLDLSSNKIEKLKVDTGAAKMTIKLGDKLDKTDVKMNAGLASIKIEIPKNSAVELKIEGLAGKDFSGFTKIEKGLYRTENFESSSKKVYIDLQGLTNLDIIRY